MMALNPLIAMQGQNNIDFSPLNNALLNYQQTGRQMQADAMAKEQHAAQMQNNAQQQFNDEQKSVIIASGALKQYLDAGDMASAKQYLLNRKQNLQGLGLNTNDTDWALTAIEKGDPQLKQYVDGLYQVGLRSGILREPMAGTNASVKIAPTQTGYDVINPLTGETIRSISGVKPSLEQKTQAEIDAARGKGDIAVDVAGRTRQAQAGVDLATKPGIAAATTSAEQTAKADVDRNTQMRKNGIAYNVYQTGMGNLLKSLGDTTTGPITGRIPAITASAQIAEGARATMAPVLKQMFREAGEGTFTEGDQKLLMDMLPGRNDHPEAAKAKIKMIDDIVAQKLGSATTSQPPQQGSAAQGVYQQGQIIEHGGKRYRVIGGDPNDPDVEEVQ